MKYNITGRICCEVATGITIKDTFCEYEVEAESEKEAFDLLRAFEETYSPRVRARKVKAIVRHGATPFSTYEVVRLVEEDAEKESL